MDGNTSVSQSGQPAPDEIRTGDPHEAPGTWTAENAEDAAARAARNLWDAARCPAEGEWGVNQSPFCNAEYNMGNLEYLLEGVKTSQPQVADELASAIQTDPRFEPSLPIATLHFLERNMDVIHDPRNGVSILKEELEQYRDACPTNSIERRFAQYAIDHFDQIKDFVTNDWDGALMFDGNEPGISRQDLKEGRIVLHELIQGRPTRYLVEFLEQHWSEITQRDDMNRHDLLEYARTCGANGDMENQFWAEVAADRIDELARANTQDAGQPWNRHNAAGMTWADVEVYKQEEAKAASFSLTDETLDTYFQIQFEDKKLTQNDSRVTPE